MGSRGVDHVAGQDQLHRAAFAYQICQALRPAAAGHDAEVYFRLRKSGVLAADTYVAREGEFAPAAEAKSVDHRDDGFRKRVYRIEERPFVKQVTLGHGRLSAEFADVGPGDEGLFA